MCMNSKDERLYHYEYRRPRHYNPTYNSNNLFDSLNMFVRQDYMSNSSMASNGRYSLPKQNNSMMNHSELIEYRSNRPMQNNSTISQEPERRQTPLLTDKDNHYLKMLEDKQRVMGHEMTNSRMMRDNNPEHMPEPRSQRLNYKLGDSLSRELHDFEKR